jgi:hypothetical protein
MPVFAIRIKHPFDVAVQCPHGADARHHGGLSKTARELIGEKPEKAK